MRKATRTQWIKFSIVTLLYLAFLVWVKSWLGLIVLPFIFDIYISKKIPWGFWKKSENPAVRSIMSWVDAIVFALVAVYFVNIYVFQNYQIPSSSLEKSLLVGDFLYVSKMSYGPRVPNTPLSMPLAQHTLPVFNTKSYIEWPQWEYKRVPGFGKVKLNDIVVFNFPAGDTVATNFQQTDFYTLAYEEGKVNENMLLFEVARYNFSTFLVKNFDLAFAHERGIGMLQIRPFSNYDEAQQYFRRLYANPEMATRLSGMRAILISEANYEQLIKQYSFDDYDTFYRAHFSSIPEPELKGYTLDEPLLNLPTEEEERKKEENLPMEEDDPENGVIFED